MKRRVVALLLGVSLALAACSSPVTTGDNSSDVMGTLPDS